MMLKITTKQRTKINALVRRSCCNCYKGNCLLLDDGEEAKCTQLISRYGCRGVKACGLYARRKRFFKINVAGLKGTVHGNLTAKRDHRITTRRKRYPKYFEMRYAQERNYYENDQQHKNHRNRPRLWKYENG